MSANVSSTQAAVTAHGSFQAAFEATAKARAALAPEDVLTINVDPQSAVATVLGALPNLQKLRAAIAAEFATFDIAEFDALETYAQALAEAQSTYSVAAEPTDALPALAARAAELRDTLLADTQALVRRGHIDSKRLAELKGGNGYLNAGSDLGALVKILREHWSTIESNTGVKVSELDEGRDLFERITIANAGRTQPSRTAASADDDRRRAFTLVVNAYKKARRAAAYLRGADETDKLLPSLWTGRGRAKQVTPDVDSDAPVVPVGDAPVVPDGDAPVAPGMPGGSPFA